MRIHDILSTKGFDVIHIRPESSVGELVRLLQEHNLGAVVVSPDGRTIDGIVSERDVVRRLHADESLLEAPVSSIMSSPVHTCGTDATVNELMEVMTERRFRHVPVVVDGRLLGIMSIGDVVKSRMSELQFERDQLDSYVHSSQT